ncbi:hypothetical protein KX928_21870 [Roseobacter sp. YSTF-M11]|uniref:Uncharacterized protein n=1 Tax=Roseobacter insulae TaxID=2859783 RepID=A0A9X1FZV1_9RHOB|nr:hypothetical protein [Roseobacter insulae]MBW4710447.1 hypothetical protein [Roseobacter insulae]
MLDEEEPFTTFEPGQLITAESMNAMQSKMRAEIAKKIAEALAALTEIDKAKDSDALEGSSAEDLLAKFLEQAMQQFPTHTGYRKLFKVLEFDERNLIDHQLKLCPLVDLYELKSFEVICAHDDDKHREEVRFFLYHTSEKKLRHDDVTVEIEATGETPFRIPLAELLDYLDVEYTDDSSLGDLETELWTAMFAAPNDSFDPADYCHSPWYERCCREERTVGSLKAKGDWDELWLKMRPCKTVNPPADRDEAESVRLPRGILVEHHDFDQLSLTLKEPIFGPNGDEARPMCVMVLLKV